VLPEDDWQLRLDAPEDGSGIGILTLDYFVMPEFTPVADQLAQVLRPPE